MAQSITVSVLFTDLVGSTELAEHLGPEAAHAVRRDHFAALRSAIYAHDGTEVKNLGDGLMVVFPSVRMALDGAVAIQQHVERDNRARSRHLQVRIGLATGDATLDDGDYYGPPVVEAARLCEAAAGGGILTTELVHLHGARTGHGFRPLGEHRLKGLAEPMAVFELEWTPAPATSPVPLPRRLERRPEGGFVGYNLDKSKLLAAYHAVADSQGRRAVLLTGDAGIGKTTLASELARTAHGDGAIVLYGRCEEDLGIPYQPFAEALRHYVAHAPKPLLQDHFSRYGEALGRLGSSLTPDLPTTSERPADPDTERYLLYEAVVALLSSAAAEAPLVLVLDDLHWADHATMLLLRHVVASPDVTDVLVVAAFRDPGPDRSHPLSQFRAAMRRQVDVEVLHLQGLDDVEMAAWMEAVAGSSLGRQEVKLAHTLRRETAGNPFFAAEILRHLAEVGVATGDLESVGLPESVRDVVGQRASRLGPETEDLLRVAAVVGREFDLELLAGVTGRTEADLAEQLAPATAAALLLEIGDGVARYSFAHALVRLTFYEDLGAARRQLVHRRTAEALEALYGHDPGPRIAELAWHWVAASAPADLGKAIEYCRLAGDAALAALAGAEAERWYGDALRLLEREPSPAEETRLQLLVSLGEAQRQAGDPAHRETLLDAAHLAVRLGDRAALVRAALTNYRGWHSIPGKVDVERVEALEAALTEVGPAETPERARLLKQLSVELSYSGDYTRCRSLDDEAVRIARRLGDPATLLQVLIRGQAGCWGPDTLAQRLDASREAVRLAEEVGDPAAGCWAYTDLAAAAFGVANVDEADAAARRRDELAEQSGQPVHRWRTRVMQSARALLAGDLAAAEVLASEALQIGKESGQPDAMAGYVINISSIRWHQGRPNEFIPALEKTLEDFSTKHGYYGMLARACLDVGDDVRARELVAFGHSNRFDPPWDIDWLVTMAMWAECVVRLEDAAAAAVIYERLAPWHGEVVMVPSMTDSCVAHYLGTLTAVLGDHSRSRLHLDEALAIHQSLRGPFHIARTQLALARTMLAEEGRSGADYAGKLLAEALAVARRRGYDLIRRDCEALLRK